MTGSSFAGRHGHAAIRVSQLCEVLEAAATRALSLRYKIWGFGEGPALAGLVEAGQLLQRPQFVDFVEDLVQPALNADAAPTDHLIPVEALLALHHARPRVDVSHAIERFAKALLTAPRPVEGQPPVHRPDLENLGTTVWVDCLHTDGPGLALAGYPDLAVQLLEEVCEHLQGPAGLFSHGLNVASGSTNHVHWGRGQGWALHGLEATIALAPDHGGLLTVRLEALLTALARLEENGRWHTVVDDPASPLENSVSAMVAATAIRGTAHRLLAPSWRALGLRALTAAWAHVDTDGGLPVSEATPAGAHAAYFERQVGIYPWGQGPLIVALIEAIRSAERS